MNKKVKKVDNFVINLLYASLYQFIIVPILSLMSYKLFENAMYYYNYPIYEVIILLILLIIDISLVYLICYSNNKLFKMPIEYHGFLGAACIGVFLAIYFYLNVKEASVCVDVNSNLCTNEILLMRYVLFALIFQLIFYILFILLDRITKKQIYDDESKSKKKVKRGKK